MNGVGNSNGEWSSKYNDDCPTRICAIQTKVKYVLYSSSSVSNVRNMRTSHLVLFGLCSPVDNLRPGQSDEAVSSNENWFTIMDDIMSDAFSVRVAVVFL